MRNTTFCIYKQSHIQYVAGKERVYQAFLREFSLFCQYPLNYTYERRTASSKRASAKKKSNKSFEYVKQKCVPFVPINKIVVSKESNTCKNIKLFTKEMLYIESKIIKKCTRWMHYIGLYLLCVSNVYSNMHHV